MADDERTSGVTAPYDDRVVVVVHACAGVIETASVEPGGKKTTATEWEANYAGAYCCCCDESEEDADEDADDAAVTYCCCAAGLVEAVDRSSVVAAVTVAAVVDAAVAVLLPSLL